MTWSLRAHLVQGSTDTNGFTSSAIDTTGADLLILFMNDTSAATTFTDSFSNSWATAAGPTSVNGPDSTIFYAKNAKVGSNHTFTLTATNQSPTIIVQAWSGSDITANDDQANQANASFTATIQPGSVTPTLNDELVVSDACCTVNVTLSIDSSFTISDQLGFTGSQHWGAGAAYLIQTASVAVNPTWSGGANYTGATIATFKSLPFQPMPIGGSGGG